MSVDLRFLSYLRRGMARLIGEQADGSGIPQRTSGDRHHSPADGRRRRSTEPFRSAGPGSITGLAAGEVLRVDPPAGPTIIRPISSRASSFRTPDLPWRYTPAQPNGENLLPWLVLVVVDRPPGQHARRRRLRALGAQRRRRGGAAGPEGGVGLGACADRRAEDDLD